MRRAAVVIAMSFAVGSAAIVGAQRTFRTSVDLVHFSVTVTNRQGVPVDGLTAADFEIVEGGKPQTIRFFAAGDPAEAPPLHIGFLLDLSGSMSEDISNVRSAAIKFLNAMESAEDVTVVDFDTEVRRTQFRATEYPRLIERIRMRKPDGYTALYDALAVYLNGAGDQNGDKVLVMYTDGGDTRSALTLSEVLELLKASDVTVYAIGYLEHQLQSARSDQRMHLQRFADMTGGQALFPSSIKEVEKMYERIQKEIAARYSLGYTSSDTRTDGKWRDVEIRLTRKDLKGVKLRTRSGYYALYKPQGQ